MQMPKVFKTYPWLLYVIGVILILAVIVGAYQFAKYQGRQEEKQRRNAMVVESLKKAQESMLLADKFKKEAENAEAENEKLKAISTTNKQEAEKKESQYTAVHQQQNEEIENEYQRSKDFINRDMSDCDRCRDICQRSNNLANTYGPDFAEFACDPTTQCSLACQ